MKFGIVFGGISFEHEISIVSAIVVKKILKSELSFIFIDKFRDFYLIDPKNLRANFFSSYKYKKSKKLTLEKGGFLINNIFNKKLDIDCYINLIHGGDGEDGKLAGMFEFYNINFIGPRLEASVLSFNKELTKLFSTKCGIKTLPYEMLKRGDKPTKIPFPFILKPLRLGSSIGVVVIKDIKELDYALDIAFEFDDDVLVEPYIEGIREFNLAGFKANNEMIYSMIEEPNKKDFLDFEQKYMSFSQNKIKSAELNDKLKTKFYTIFKKIYESGNFYGALIRCDFFLLDDEIYLNEINPSPGSMANYLFEDFNDCIEKLAKSFQHTKNIEINYKFINSITSNKGKL